MKKILLGVIFVTARMMLSPPVFAGESTPASVHAQQGMAASEHAGHGEHAEADGMREMGRMSKPVAWTSFPVLKTRMGGGSGESREITVTPQNIVADSIDAYSNDVKAAGMHRQLPFTLAGAMLDRPESGGFHWLAAREEHADKVRVASTVYFFSNPGKNPTAMFMQQKHELEIVPQPFPREHSRYRANEDWKFLVRFNSKPLAGHKVNLETQNGTKTELTSDAQGVITVHLPDDFKAEPEQNNMAERHSHGRHSSDFVLATEQVEGGKTYLTGFNGSYGTDAFDRRSIAMGLGFIFLGMIGAAPLLRPRKAAKKAADAGQTPDASAAPEITRNEEA